MAKTLKYINEAYRRKRPSPAKIFKALKVSVSSYVIYNAVKRLRETGRCIAKIRNTPKVCKNQKTHWKKERKLKTEY